jgi:predicted TIM-barrel fold metal-dependent hydrolase
LTALAEAREIVGVKLYPGFEAFFPTEERCYPIYEVCVRHNMPIVFHSGETMNQTWRERYNHPHEIAKVARQFPSLKIVVAHFSQPHLVACQQVVSAYPNVYADISGLAHPSVIKVCGQKAISQHLEGVVIQHPGKVLFGSDWPLCNVGEHLRLVASLPISDSDKALILAGNAQRVFGLR